MASATTDEGILQIMSCKDWGNQEWLVLLSAQRLLIGSSSLGMQLPKMMLDLVTNVTNTIDISSCSAAWSLFLIHG